MKAGQWIDRVKAYKGLPSDYAAADVLGLSRFTVSGYRKRPNATLDEKIAVKVAHVLNIQPAVVLADQAMELSKDEEAKTAWGAVLERLGGMAASVFLTAGLVGGLASSPDARSAGSSQNNSNQPIENLYIV